MARLGPGRVVVECSEGLAALLAPCRRADAPGRPPAAGPDGVAGARLDEFLQVCGDVQKVVKSGEKW